MSKRSFHSAIKCRQKEKAPCWGTLRKEGAPRRLLYNSLISFPKRCNPCGYAVFSLASLDEEITPRFNNQLGTFLPFARKNFCKLSVNDGYNDKKSRYTAHQISGRKSLAISLMKLCTGSEIQKPSMSAFSAPQADAAIGAAQPQSLSAASLCFISDIQLWDSAMRSEQSIAHRTFVFQPFFEYCF